MSEEHLLSLSQSLTAVQTEPTGVTMRRRLLWRRLARRFFRLSGGRRRMVVEAVMWLAFARLALLIVPFRTLAARFGTFTRPDAISPGGAAMLTDGQRHSAEEVGWAVTRAARYVPFRAVCLPQAIAAKYMLGRRRVASVMHFGVAKSKDKPMAAHAWLDAGDIEVTGFPVGPEFVELARFQ
jgi:hypothetical protein